MANQVQITLVVEHGADAKTLIESLIGASRSTVGPILSGYDKSGDFQFEVKDRELIKALCDTLRLGQQRAVTPLNSAKG